MRKNFLWLVVSGLIALSLVVAACGQAAAPTAPAPTPTAPTAPTAPTTPATPATPAAPVEEKQQKAGTIDQKGGAVPILALATENPQYGGTLFLSTSSDTIPRSDTTLHTVASTFINLVNEELTGGDWTLGPAGGWGTNIANWAGNPDRWEHRTGVIAESWKWTIDQEKNEGTIVYKIRQGVRWVLDPKSEASRLVGGREFIADDAVFHMKRTITEKTAYFYLTNPELRGANIAATGKYEVTVKVPLEAMISAIGRFGDSMQLEAPEVIQKYGSQKSWREMVGTGPYIITDYVPGSVITKQKNPNYWMTDPIGPGKGNKLPYIDTIKYLVLPDSSTRQAAFRTGKVDVGGEGTEEEIDQMKQRQPFLLGFGEGSFGSGNIPCVSWRTDRPPFDDVRVRRALHMAVDFPGINQSVFRGRGKYPSRPFTYDTSYKELYLPLDDPSVTPEVRELWEYKPEKAKQLLKEAGYPNGFKTKVQFSGSADAWSILKDMWAKIGIELEFEVKEGGVISVLTREKKHEAIVGCPGGNPLPVWYSMPAYFGTGQPNGSMINDPIINETVEKARLAALFDGEKAAFKMLKELSLHIYSNAEFIGSITSGLGATRYWWPWLKNYNGEANVGYFNDYSMKFVWIDQALKKSLGH